MPAKSFASISSVVQLESPDPENTQCRGLQALGYRSRGAQPWVPAAWIPKWRGLGTGSEQSSLTVTGPPHPQVGSLQEAHAPVPALGRAWLWTVSLLSLMPGEAPYPLQNGASPIKPS